MKTWAELTQEHTRIQAENARFRQLLLEKETALAKRDAYIEELTEALILARNRKFAASAESLCVHQRDLFNEVEVSAQVPEDEVTEGDIHEDDSALASPIDVPAHRRRRGGRAPLSENLPRIEIIHDLPEDEKVCPHGHALSPMKTTHSEQLDIVPMKIQVIRHVQHHYACSCCEGYIKSATKPIQPLPKSQASAGLLAFIAVSKYADGLPLYRQTTLFSRFDVQMDRTTLANWMIKCGQLVQPLINRIEEHLLSAPYVHIDETTVQVLNEAGKTAQSQSYMWVRSTGAVGQRLILFDYDPSRSQVVPKRLLAEYTGAIMTDGYEGYGAVCREQGLVRLGCWAHARRGFVEAGKVLKKKTGKADYALKQIATLYQLEKQLAREHHQDLSNEDWIAHRYHQRQQIALPILKTLKDWLDQTQPVIAPKTTLGKALGYLQNQWPRLIRYVEDGRYPIDNNPAENAIRPFAVGRKNWLFSTSVQGAKASANLYGLIETAKANGVEPYAYLQRVFEQLPNITNYDDVDRLLPFKIKDAVH